MNFDDDFRRVHGIEDQSKPSQFIRGSVIGDSVRDVHLSKEIMLEDSRWCRANKLVF